MVILRLVGTARFELATPCTPSKCATRLRYVPMELRRRDGRRRGLTQEFYTIRDGSMRAGAKLAILLERDNERYNSRTDRFNGKRVWIVKRVRFPVPSRT
jgi:hypothetical protein